MFLTVVKLYGKTISILKIKVEICDVDFYLLYVVYYVDQILK